MNTLSELTIVIPAKNEAKLIPRLSKQVARSKFAIIRGGVYTTNRRFQKMGHFRVARLFLKTAFNYWNEQHFLRDHNYWQV